MCQFTVSARESSQTREIWQDLAKQEGIDPETLRKQVRGSSGHCFSIV